MATMPLDATSRLETLPLHLLEHVCQYLAPCAHEGTSLRSFSLASTVCFEAAARLRFRHVCVTAEDKHEFASKVESLRALLVSRHCVNLVRRIEVTVTAPLYRQPEVRDNDQDDDLPVQEKTSYHAACNDVEDRFIDPPYFSTPYCGDRRRLSEDVRQQQDELWQPLAHVIELLPCLVDLIYASAEQLPRCLLSALHRYSPQTRLHMHTFSLGSLYGPLHDPCEMEEHEFAILSSPCLHSVILSSSGYVEDEIDYNYEAMLEAVARYAPRLKYVWIHSYLAANSPKLLRTAWGPRPVWRGPGHVELGYPRTTKTVGRLQGLVLSGERTFSVEELTSWSRRTDFTNLKSLEIYQRTPLATIKGLAELAEGGQLGAIRRLALEPSFEGEEADAMDEATSLLLKALGPLETLTLFGMGGSETLRSLRRSSKHVLRYLCLNTNAVKFQVSQFKHLWTDFSRLQELKVPVLRSRGDANEVASYRAIGNIESLTRLTLWLEININTSICPLATQTVIADVSPDGPDKELLERIAGFFVDAAVDASLARSIFRVLSSAQSRLCYPRRPRLQYLEIYPQGMEGVSIEGIDDRFGAITAATWLARPWICERAQDAEDIIVKEHPRSYWRTARFDMDEMREESAVCDRAWKALWPNAAADWKQDWTSFPLCDEQ